MKARPFAIIACAAALSAGNAWAAPPSVEACGGAAINRGEGYRDGRVVSRMMENRIEDFLQKADALPGAGIAIVKGDRAVYARGFGFRNLALCEKATSDTRFYLKSTTKSFLAAAAAILQEEGAIDLDAPISDYLPDLRFPDGLRPEQTSLRAHLTHTQPYFDAGLNYRTAFAGNLTEEDFVNHVNEFSKSKDIKFRYSNFGPIMAARAISAKTGMGWRELIREKIFAPAGMTDSFTSMMEAENGPMAQGYLGGFNAEYEPELTKTESQMHAAGGSVSTPADLARWVIISLSDGVIDGEQALPKRAIEQTKARQVQIDWDILGYKRFAHGLGVYSADYEGDVLMHHFGGETHLSYMPEHGYGVIVLTNELNVGVHVTHALASTIYDMLLGKKHISARIENRLSEIAEREAKGAGRLEQYLAQVRKNAPDAPPVYAAADLIGDYVDPRLGEMSVIAEGDDIKIIFGAISGSLEYLGGDSYLADIGLWNTMPPQVFVFRPDGEGRLVLDWGGRIFVRQD